MNTLTQALSGRTSIYPPHGMDRVIQFVPDVLHPPSPLPFFLSCLGSTWEGHLIGWKEDCLQLRMTGFPPIERFQYVQLRFFVNDQKHSLQQYQGLIQEIRVQTGSSPWEGTTDLLLQCGAGNGATGTLHSEMGDLPSAPAGNVLFGRILEDLIDGLSNTGMSSDSLPTPASFLRQNGEKDKPLDSLAGKGRIRSSPLTIKKDDGQLIRAYHDRPEGEEVAELPVVVISPGYGETKRDYLTLAYYFAGNGFQVVRYDYTNHVGESDGSHYQVSLSSMKEDFQTVTRFVRATWPHTTLIGVASSLGARVALRAEAERPSVALLVMLMGIVNVQRSVVTVHQEDLFAKYVVGESPDSANFLGFNVGNQFLGDAISNNFVTLEHTLHDAESLGSPVIVVSAGKDAWVAPEDLQVFRKALGSRVESWIVVPGALHRLQENPKIARETYREVVVKCQERAAMPSSYGVIHYPNRLELGRQNRTEKIAMQQLIVTEVGTGFWEDYLGHFQSVGKCPDYVKLLDHVFHALGPVSAGQQVLDAGCGNGNAGLFLLNRLRPAIPGVVPFMDESIHYVGIDVAPEALKRASKTILSAISELQQAYAHPLSLMKMSWAQVDLGSPLPFPDNQFDRIVSNLVLGYIADPLAALKELYRVLTPGGRMVISNLKPNGDFSGIYQSLVSSAALPQQREEARVLLSNYGKIRQAEREGQFCFFDRTQWESIGTALGCMNVKVYPTFAGQAFLIVLEKPAVQTPVSLPAMRNEYRPQPLHAESDLLKQVA